MKINAPVTLSFLYFPCPDELDVHSAWQTALFSVCVGGRLDVVFVVPASTDRTELARPLRELLTSAAGSLATVGPRDSQVVWMFKSHKSTAGLTKVDTPLDSAQIFFL